MRDNVTEFEQAGAQVLVVDPHEQWSAKQFLKEIGLGTADVSYPLLLDPTNVVSATYGVAFQMRVHTEISNRPATFVIDRHGVIQYERRGQTFGDRPTVEEMLDVVKKLR